MLDLLLFAFLNFLGAVSPGPDFAIVTKYGLTGSRRAALHATWGIGLALFIHVFYCISGIAFFLSSSPLLMDVVRVLGALYLGYLGVTILVQERGTVKEGVMPSGSKVSNNPFMAGFLTNLLNPKATVFLVSLFSQFASAMVTWKMKIAFGLVIPCVAVLWFTLLTYFLTHPYFLPLLQKHRRKFMSVMGIILCFLCLSGLISVIL